MTYATHISSLTDIRLLHPQYPGAAKPDDVVCYGIEGEVPFRAPWNPWPRLVDIDGDGRLDLVRFGAFCRDEVFLNQGTETRPAFDYFHTLSPIPFEPYYTDLVYGVGPIPNTQRTAIEVADWDGDGGQDLIINGWYRFEVYLDQGRDADPRWILGPSIRTPNGVLTVLPQAVPRLVDWDGDGKQDLLFTSHPADESLSPILSFGPGGFPSVGVAHHGTRSEFYFCRNIGTRNDPLFDEPQLMMCDHRICL